MEQLVQEHYEFVMSIAKKYAYRYGVDEDLANNVAMERLLKCAKVGDKQEQTGVPFQGYLERSVRLDILHTKRRKVIVSSAVTDYAETSIEEVRQEMPEFMAWLLEYKHRQILAGRQTGYSYGAIGQTYGVSKKRIQFVKERIDNNIGAIASQLVAC